MKILVTLLVAMTLVSVPLARAETKPVPVPAPASAPAANAKSDPSWLVRCEDLKKANHCEVYQRLSVQQKGWKQSKRLAEFAIGYKQDNKKEAQGALILPLGILVNEPISIEIDEKKDFTVEIRHCNTEGCFALVEMSSGLLDKMSKGKKLVIKAKAVTGQNLHIVMLLDGIAATLEKVKARS